MILILKAGTTNSNIKARYGDFEDWIITKMNLDEDDFLVHSVGDYQITPPDLHYTGVVITGSHSMVTDLDLKNSKLCLWLLDEQKRGVPILGICFGHQLLSVLSGGNVDYNIAGTKMGSTNTHLTHAGQQDKLLGALPHVFAVYKAHKQSVIEISGSIEVLAIDDSGMIDAFRINDNTWGVQFHPEFTGDIAKSYLHEKFNELSAEGLDVHEISNNVMYVDYGETILNRFREIADSFDNK